MIRLVSIVGARPNFVKLAAICEAVAAFNNRQVSEGFTKAAIYGSGTFQKIEHVIIHTGQHSSDAMSGQIWRELNLPEPINVKAKYAASGDPERRLAWIMLGIDNAVGESEFNCCLVYGDCDSTLAGALWAHKSGFRLAHVEAGLRSGDRTMPEETNRILVDQLSDFLFVSEKSGCLNLNREGLMPVINPGRPWPVTVLVGNTMIESLIKFSGSSNPAVINATGGFTSSYAILTLHRPSNVDDPKRLVEILKAVNGIEDLETILFPVHPRTRRSWTGSFMGVWPFAHIQSRDPYGYIDFVNILANAKLVLTDSGGVQEEAAFLGVPCLTLRDTTERPATLVENGGTNKLVGCDAGRIVEAAREALRQDGGPRRSALKLPETWDGKAGQRIVEVLAKQLGQSGN